MKGEKPRQREKTRKGTQKREKGRTRREAEKILKEGEKGSSPQSLLRNIMIMRSFMPRMILGNLNTISMTI